MGTFQNTPQRGGNRLSLCSDVTELHETGKSDLESDFSDREGKLFCGISGQSAGRYDGKAAPQQKVSIYESRCSILERVKTASKQYDQTAVSHN